MSVSLFKEIINVDSSKRSYGEISNFFIQLEHPSTIKSLSIKSIEFPNSMYNISSANNTLTTSLGNAVVPVGFYNASEIVSALEIQLQILDASFDVSLNSVSGKLTISKTGTFSITSTPLSLVLGISATQTLTGLSTYTGANLVNLSVNRDVYFICGELPIRTNGSQSGRNVLFKLPLNVALGAFQFTSFDWVIDLVSPKTITGLTFRLEDVNGQILNTNGVDWSLSIYTM